jgi:hypothetical protein
MSYSPAALWLTLRLTMRVKDVLEDIAVNEDMLRFEAQSLATPFLTGPPRDMDFAYPFHDMFSMPDSSTISDPKYDSLGDFISDTAFIKATDLFPCSTQLERPVRCHGNANSPLQC